MLKTKGLAFITIVYWFLLVYIVAALVWWFISLEQQNDKMSRLLLQEVKQNDPAYAAHAKAIAAAQRRKTVQYIGEGITFFVLIVIGAIFVYRATRKQLRLSHQQQNFMMAVTHELKTPIAITLLNLETMQKRRLEEAQQQKLIGNTLQEANRLNALCNNILLASQLEAGGYHSTKHNIDLSVIAATCAHEFVQRFPMRKIEALIKEDITLMGEPLLLQLMMNNLVENALKYAPKDTIVTIQLIQQNNRIIFSVADEGPGIPESEQQKIFEKFYRIGNETTRIAKGTGLGLYLCKKIAADHHGHIAVANNLPAGAVFSVTFKLS